MDKFEAIRLYGLASNFWQLTLNISDELIKHGNPSSMFYKGWHWPSTEDYENHTKWSDTNIVEPTLFIFYHGIELSLKALILAKGKESKNNHKLSELTTKVKVLYGKIMFIDFYEKYTIQKNLPDILQNFCQTSGMTIDLYYQILKYPTSINGVKFNHSVLRANNENGIALFQTIFNDLKAVKNDIEECIIRECKDSLG